MRRRDISTVLIKTGFSGLSSSICFQTADRELITKLQEVDAARALELLEEEDEKIDVVQAVDEQHADFVIDLTTYNAKLLKQALAGEIQISEV